MSESTGIARSASTPAPLRRAEPPLPPVRSDWGVQKPERRHRNRRKQRRRPLTRQEVIQRALLATPLVAAGFAVWAFGGVYGWAYGCAYGLIFAGLAVWAALAAAGVLGAAWRPVYWALAAFAGLVGLQYFAHLSFVPSATSSAALHLGAGGALFILVSQCYSGDRDSGWITAAFSIFTGALAMLAILQALTGAQGIYWHFTYLYASPAGSFVNRNHFSGCMELLLPMATVAAWRRRNRPPFEFLPWAAVPALGLASVLLAASRGGLLALAAEAILLGGLLAYLAWQRSRVVKRGPDAMPIGAGYLPLPVTMIATGVHRRKTRGAVAGVTVLIAVAITAVMVWVVGTSKLQGRVQATESYEPSVAQRDNLDLSSWAMFKARATAGWGLGTWPDVYPGFARFTDEDVFLFAHNDYLQFLSENGWLGVGCVLLFWGLWALEFRRQVRKWPMALLLTGTLSPPSVAVSVAASFSCVGILVHSWVDYNLHIPSNLLVFFTIAALALGPTRLSARS